MATLEPPERSTVIGLVREAVLLNASLDKPTPLESTGRAA
ncbi:MAG: hypothetical protein JWO70_4165 [Betaproteobacteria bacterium]|nr:hypothetical protein [Betaproteobacteria bacterium]